MSGRNRIDVPGLRRIEGQAQAIARAVDAQTPPGWGFAVLWFEHDGDGTVYVSSCSRETMPTALREMADVLERGGDRPAGRLGSEH